MKSPNTKSSDQLKREVDQQVRKVRNDIDSFQGRLSPGQLIDDAIFYPHGRSLSSTVDHLKRNPVGTAFLSLGTILLMEDENHMTMESGAKNKLNTVKDSFSSVKETIRQQLPHKELTPGTVPSRGDIAKGKVNHLKENLQSKVSDLKDKIPSKEELKSKFSHNKEDLSSRATDLKEEVSAKVSELKDDVTNRFSSSDQENESNFSFSTDDTSETGEQKRKLKEKASEFLSTGRERASTAFSSGKERATDLYSSGKDRVQNMDPLSYMALGAGLGALTGVALPLSEKESSFVGDRLDDKLSGLNQDLQDAINECSNILKDLVIEDVKDFSFRPFK